MSDIDTDYLDVLLGFCDRATPGPWHVTNDPLGTHVETGDGKGRIVMKSGADRGNEAQGVADAFFIASFNPVVVRQLIERLKASETHNHGLICQPTTSLTCGLCGAGYVVCAVCHGDVYGHHAACDQQDLPN